MALTLEKATQPLNENNGTTNPAAKDLPPPPYLADRSASSDLMSTST